MTTQRQINAALDKRVERAFHVHCNGIQIPILKLPELFRLGKQAAIDGASDAELANVLYRNAVAFGKEHNG
jgi:hypothetical protein